jgi:hypothetical protein
MQTIRLRIGKLFPWDDPEEAVVKVQPFDFREMGFYGIYGSHLWPPTEVIGKAIHHPDAELALMDMMDNPARFVRPEYI